MRVAVGGLGQVGEGDHVDGAGGELLRVEVDVGEAVEVAVVAEDHLAEVDFVMEGVVEEVVTLE